MAIKLLLPAGARVPDFDSRHYQQYAIVVPTLLNARTTPLVGGFANLYRILQEGYELG